MALQELSLSELGNVSRDLSIPIHSPLPPPLNAHTELAVRRQLYDIGTSALHECELSDDLCFQYFSFTDIFSPVLQKLLSPLSLSEAVKAELAAKLIKKISSLIWDKKAAIQFSLAEVAPEESCHSTISFHIAFSRDTHTVSISLIDKAIPIGYGKSSIIYPVSYVETRLDKEQENDITIHEMVIRCLNLESCDQQLGNALRDVQNSIEIQSLLKQKYPEIPITDPLIPLASATEENSPSCEWLQKRYGDDLSKIQLLQHNKQSHLSPSFDQRLKYFLNIVEAVQKTHDEGWLHRDIRLSNVFFYRNSRRQKSALLADFDRSIPFNTPMSPPQIPYPYWDFLANYAGLPSHFTDHYSLGMMLGELLLPNFDCSLAEMYTKTPKKWAKKRAEWFADLLAQVKPDNFNEQQLLTSFEESKFSPTFFSQTIAAISDFLKSGSTPSTMIKWQTVQAKLFLLNSSLALIEELWKMSLACKHFFTEAPHAELRQLWVQQLRSTQPVEKQQIITDIYKDLDSCGWQPQTLRVIERIHEIACGFQKLMPSIPIKNAFAKL